MASRRRSFQAPEGPPPQAIQLVHDMIQSFNGYDPWDPEQQDILNYRSANCLHEFIPTVHGNTGLSNRDYLEYYSAFRQTLEHHGLYHFEMHVDEIFASLEHDHIAVTTLGTAQYASGAYEMIPCLFVLHYNADSTRITRINEYVGAFLKPFIEATLPDPAGHRR